jgi:hypothetical protein
MNTCIISLFLRQLQKTSQPIYRTPYKRQDAFEILQNSKKAMLLLRVGFLTLKGIIHVKLFEVLVCM